MNYIRLYVLGVFIVIAHNTIAQSYNKYEVPNFNIEFKYPENWLLETNSIYEGSNKSINFIYLYSPEYEKNNRDEFSKEFVVIAFEIENLGGKTKTLEQEMKDFVNLWIEFHEITGLPLFKITIKKETELLRNRACWITYPTDYGTCHTIFTVIGNYKYSLSLQGSDVNNKQYMSVYTTVLESLKLIK
ncbi:hypothetical protein [Aquimarina sp. AU58]|uniref:hypothetical protein n=1 Tax=Aquimarina sp. AU58 TaxID=1874112 RepID=UPI000D645D4C|nr:hypothetical protein [Aquimarina sp. AU58]